MKSFLTILAAVAVVAVAGSGTGRKELGNTSELIAALTGDWSESRCGLNPAPIESIAMMI